MFVEPLRVLLVFLEQMFAKPLSQEAQKLRVKGAVALLEPGHVPIHLPVQVLVQGAVVSRMGVFRGIKERFLRRKMLTHQTDQPNEQRPRGRVSLALQHGRMKLVQKAHECGMLFVQRFHGHGLFAAPCQ